MKIALLQLNVGKSAKDNFNIAKQAIVEASKNGADIALLPELWTIGYQSPENYPGGETAWKEDAYAFDDLRMGEYQRIASENNIAVMLGYLEDAGDGKYADSAVLIDRHGNLVFTYRKIHTVQSGWENTFEAGTEFTVAKLDTKKGFVNIGCMICFDREFPETARILMLSGAELILVPNASFIDGSRLSQLEARGFENMVGVAMTNYPSPRSSARFNGRSVAYDGMVANLEDYNPQLVLADDTEGIWYADYDLVKLREYREKSIWGDSYRKPHLYSKLTEDSKCN